MKFDQMTPFMRSAIVSLARNSGYEEMIGYECRLLYIEEGGGSMKINGTSHRLRKDDMVILNSGVPYNVMFERNKVRYYVIKFDCDQEHSYITEGTSGARPCDFEAEKILYHMDFEDAPQFNEWRILSNMSYVKKQVQQIYTEAKKKHIGWRTRANSLLGEILVEALRAEIRDSDMSRLRDVLDYINASYNSPMSNAEIAAKFGYHPNYLSNLFQRVTGKSLHRYLRSLRLSRAEELICTTEIPIVRIAEMCGFTDIPNFSVAFKKEMGMTPSQCRKSAELS